MALFAQFNTPCGTTRLQHSCKMYCVWLSGVRPVFHSVAEIFTMQSSNAKRNFLLRNLSMHRIKEPLWYLTLLQTLLFSNQKKSHLPVIHWIRNWDVRLTRQIPNSESKGWLIARYLDNQKVIYMGSLL